MTYLIGGYIIFIIGVFIGLVLNPDETCPRAVKGYNCRGEDYCDHRKSTLYAAKRDMALGVEELEANKETNLWGGDKDA